MSGRASASRAAVAFSLGAPPSLDAQNDAWLRS